MGGGGIGGGLLIIAPSQILHDQWANRQHHLPEADGSHSPVVIGGTQLGSDLGFGIGQASVVGLVVCRVLLDFSIPVRSIIW